MALPPSCWLAWATCGAAAWAGQVGEAGSVLSIRWAAMVLHRHHDVLRGTCTMQSVSALVHCGAYQLQQCMQGHVQHA